MTEILFAFLGLAAGIGLGWLIGRSVQERRAGTAAGRARDLVAEAQREADTLRREGLVEAKDEALRLRQDAERTIRSRQQEAEREEARLVKLEQVVEGKTSVLEAQEKRIAERENDLGSKEIELNETLNQRKQDLERIAGFTAEQAKEALVKEIEADAKREAMVLVRTLEEQAREESDRRARKIVTLTIQRVASELTTEGTISVITLPNDDMKGRIIGREGRNIRAFESITGANIVVDDTPESVVLSCFDPVRREMARLTLETLVSDGRIQPARIEEAYSRARGEVEREIIRMGEWAAMEVGVTDFHPEMIKVLGRLNYRTSYGQNVLKHSVEAAQIAASIAAELGADVRISKRGTLLHDIGKAITNEVEGSHALIGAELARRLKEIPAVVHAIESHHQEVEQRTVEAVIVQSADAISGSRPGARRESLETYVKRLQRLEAIAESFTGVEKVYAMQAGREVRVMVRPGDVDDVQADVLARDIAKRIEEELQYPGQIKVMVLREHRAVEYAK